ncbi:MAG: ThiF family adenylyltransferase [Phycisphaerales bacterium]|nr:MAG: ThiF family adenylyltransferase [Phycisphaerales bacterium]
MVNNTDVPNDARYARQRILPQIGDEGQTRLSCAHVAIVGVGALGTQCADLLARAGVGHLTLIDRDIVELTNLQRQTLFTEADAAQSLPKVVAAAQRLREVNHTIVIDAIPADVRPSNIATLLALDVNASSDAEVGSRARPTLILDCTDNFQARYLLNDVAVRFSLPLIYAGVLGTNGTQFTVRPSPHAIATPCLRCVFPDCPAPGTTPTCESAGVLGPAVGVMASLQAAEAIHAIVDPASIPARLHTIEVWPFGVRSIDLGPPNPECPCCAHRQFDFLDATRHESQAESTLCGQNAVQIVPMSQARLDLASIASSWQSAAGVKTSTANRFFARLELADHALRLTLFPDARAIVQGTTDITIARNVYARYVGL